MKNCIDCKGYHHYTDRKDWCGRLWQCILWNPLNNKTTFNGAFKKDENGDCFFFIIK